VSQGLDVLAEESVVAHEVVHNLFVGGREPQYPDTYGLIVSVQEEVSS
jgi:hypothetical protein